MPPTPNHVPFLHLHQVTHLVRNSALVRISGVQEDSEPLALLSGLRIWHCHELWCGLQMWLGSHNAVALA